MLDTNVVLDWLVFRNRDGAALYDAIESRRVCWLVSEALRQELTHVLGRGVVDAWSTDHGLLWESWRQLSREVPQPVAQGDASKRAAKSG
ncbi:MAG: PIN domain-containing protein [Rhizobacter sp.]|nr:PIN domain-containing protein [Rhizobacter sp.]